jgi:hypothetical protein
MAVPRATKQANERSGVALRGLPQETLARGVREIATLALAVCRADTDQVRLPDCATIGLSGSVVAISASELAASRNTIQQLWSAIRDALDDQSEESFPSEGSGKYTNLLELVEALREILESLLGLSLTFQRENRAPTRARVLVEQTVDRARGTVIGIRVARAVPLVGEVEQRIKIVEQGSHVIGVDISAPGGSTRP